MESTNHFPSARAVNSQCIRARVILPSHRSANNRLLRKHQGFREELADQLVAGYRAGRKQADRPSDAYANEARFQNVGRHHPSSDACKDCALCTKKVKATYPGGIIPRGVNRHTLGIRRSNMKCEQCGVHLCVKKDNSCWIDWHTKV